jgi:hypothetical protein
LASAAASSWRRSAAGTVSGYASACSGRSTSRADERQVTAWGSDGVTE